METDMRKSGLVLTLLAATAVVFGAEPDKSVKTTPEKNAKLAAAAKCEKTSSGIPWMIPVGAAELKADAEIDVPAEGVRTRAELKVGEKLAFKLIDVVSGDAGKWAVSAVDTQIAEVGKVGCDEGGFFRKPTVTFEITAVKAGKTLLEMSLKDRRDTPIRTFRCYIEVK